MTSAVRTGGHLGVAFVLAALATLAIEHRRSPPATQPVDRGRVAVPPAVAAAVPVPAVPHGLARVSPVPPAPRAPAGADRIRVSSLPDWLRFRYEHPREAMTLEQSILVALDHHGLRRSLATCGRSDPADLLELTAEVTARGDRATADGWGCQPVADDGDARASACPCLVDRLPPHLELEITPPPGMPATPVVYSGEVGVAL